MIVEPTETPGEFKIIDDPDSPRREFSLTEKEFKAFSTADEALEKTNNSKFNGKCERNDEIAYDAAKMLAKKLRAKGPEWLIPKNPDETMRVVAIGVRPNVEVYFYYLKISNSCDKVQIGESKVLDWYDTFDSPSWALT
jgi:hypothetical protein